MPMPIVLASASPRRRELLGRLAPEFEALGCEVDETLLPGEAPGDAARRLALAKARAGAALRPSALVIGGDTLVALGSRALAKPAGPAEAAEMLAALSGRAHEVFTGVALAWPGGERSSLAVARVRFRTLRAAEIDAYVAGGEPLDKAGAYAIQGGAAEFVESLEGEVETVIGLPLRWLEAQLAALAPG